ncbi:MAG: LysR family transcriptional regulator [Rhizobiaceae bacterium]|jgi:DNA-binding transcriptional LysR family regulator|nr:LysR family transcriptional regulator [Rhizobiaceae bacterium]
MTDRPKLSLSPSSPLDWALLRSFVAVMRTGTLSAAAKVCGLTQPTIGRHVKELEALCGEMLFSRRGNLIAPTPQAYALMEHAAQMEMAALAFSRQIAGAQDAVNGTVRVSVPELLGSFIVPGIMADVQDSHPGLAIELAATNDAQDLTRREADVAVRFFRPSQPDLVMTRAGRLNVGLFASRRYLARQGRPLTLADFAQHRLIGDDSGDRIMRGMRALGLDPRRDDFSFRSDSILAQVAAVKAGLGIGSGLTLAFEGADVERLLADQIDLPFDVHVVAHADLHRSRKVRVVYDALVGGLRAATQSLGERDPDVVA